MPHRKPGEQIPDTYEEQRIKDQLDFSQTRLVAPQARNQKLTEAAIVMRELLNRRVATEKRIFDQQNQPDTRRRLAFQLENPEALVVQFWEKEMAAFLVNETDFGTYCHGENDLAHDFLDYWQLGDSSPMFWRISPMAERIVQEYERDLCGYCNDEGGEDD